MYNVLTLLTWRRHAPLEKRTEINDSSDFREMVRLRTLMNVIYSYEEEEDAHVDRIQQSGNQCNQKKLNVILLPQALLQLAVCAYVGRDLAYFTFGDEELRDDLITMYIFLKENNVTVGEYCSWVNVEKSKTAIISKNFSFSILLFLNCLTSFCV